jgi:small subunit ribosomal protein S5
MSQIRRKPIRATDTDLKEKVVAINRVAKVVKGGRRFSFSAIVVVGDGQGVVGYGLGKANEVTDAITKGIEDAKKNLVKVPILKGTIPHEQLGKFGGGFVLFKPAAAGTGVIAGGAMRQLFEALGLHDVVAKSTGTGNYHNVVRATMEALRQNHSPRQIANKLGKKLTDVLARREGGKVSDDVRKEV